MDKKMTTKFEKELNLKKIFSCPTYDEWKVEAEKLLKGAPFDKILLTDTPENITLKAIYNHEDIQDLPFIDDKPACFPFTRGTTGAKKVMQGWEVQQEIEANTIKEWNKKMVEDLKRGQNSFRMKIDKTFTYSDFDEMLTKIDLKKLYFDIECKLNQTQVLTFLEDYCKSNKIKMTDLNGSLTCDIIKYLVQKGTLPLRLDQLLDDLAKVTKKSLLKSILIDLSVYNDAGATAVDELGLMASSVVFYADAMLEKKLEVNDIFNKMTFVFSVSNNLFMEIAKLRAARYLFAKIANAYGANSESSKMRMHVKTSDYTKTVFDPWVNILRTTTEAFSAVVGGCDSLHVTPFDNKIGPADEFSRRIARNQQLVLLEESHLNAVNDPAGGSYYVESITNELIKKAWEYFLEIDNSGGIIKALMNETIQKKINESHQYKLKNAETRKDAIVGTSTFANLSEKRPKKTWKSCSKSPSGSVNVIADEKNKSELKIKPLPKRRLTESWENLRNKVEKIKPRPDVFVANIGKAAKNKPRIDFIIGYFEPAGFNCETNDGFDSVDDAIKYCLKSSADVIVLCSTDDMYPQVVPDFAKKFKEKNKNKVLVLAGYPKEHIQAFTEAGVDFYAYMRQNVVQNINDILKKMGV